MMVLVNGLSILCMYSTHTKVSSKLSYCIVSDHQRASKSGAKYGIFRDWVTLLL